jgi:hypothetical protein
VEISSPAKAVKTTTACNARRADMANSGAVELVKIAAAKAVESAGKTGGNGRARVDTR